MSTTALPTGQTYAPPAAVGRPADAAAAVPWYIVATALAATSILAGVVWDISWHRTIGRDTFWSPPHLAIYLGGVLGGLSAGYRILRTTFAGSIAERAASVRVWGFRGPLGAWVSAWGAAAMLTSAPFDDWWHNAYGLDVEILSPPHTLLALGIGGIVAGATLQALALQNQSGEARRRLYATLYAYLGGLAIATACVMATQFLLHIRMHSSLFYRVSAMVLPFFLAALSRGGRLRLPATAAAAAYMLFTCAMIWVLPLWHAEPKLGPIVNRVDHMVPPEFPLLLVVPALAIDLVLRRAREDELRGWGAWKTALVLGGAFLVAHAVVQWGFSVFYLRHPLADTWFFAANEFDYATDAANTYRGRGEFWPGDASESAARTGMLIAVSYALLSARIGLAWGDWMRRVRR
ncbi:MAG: hypothetical protein ACJ8AO_18875 [Gemmatimonadaceae bacterium]